MSEFHRLTLLAALDQVRVVLEDGVYFFIGRNLLSLQHPPPGLINDLLTQVAVSRDLLAKLVDRHAPEHVDAPDLGGLVDDLARAFQHLPGDAEECAILGHLLGVPLSGRHAFEFLHAAARATSAVGEALHAAGQCFMEFVDQSRDGAHRVPQ